LGVGFQASALHHIRYAVTDGDASFSTEPPPGWPFPPIPGVRYRQGALRFRSPAAADIVAWRDRLAGKYQDLLGERLCWDETSDFMVSEDVGTSDDLALRYIAAFVDGSGAEAIRQLVGTLRPSYEEFVHVFTAADARGLSGQFPQLVIAPKFWLPFHRNTVIEELDWEGRPEQFGSIYRLEEELGSLRELIGNADPQSMERSPDREPSEMVLHAAWQASSTLASLCSAATSNQLPFWTTG